MIHFPDKTLQRYTIIEEKSGVYGETIQKYVYADDIIVDFQNENNGEIAHQYGVELKDLYRIYADIETTINPSDQLHDGNVIYDIIGGIQKYSKFHNYQKAHLVRRR